ncbi:hypothetical protein MRB53_002192 [Persea americana]|uniref:Uncharacterized protein n=1 Tax=Persea americana TaxID=3435 RepID=A0ACC2MVF8_PERAE|nr:hypothetical protein MRB53_002192 [Persea americana]
MAVGNSSARTTSLLIEGLMVSTCTGELSDSADKSWAVSYPSCTVKGISEVSSDCYCTSTGSLIASTLNPSCTVGGCSTTSTSLALLVGSVCTRGTGIDFAESSTSSMCPEVTGVREGITKLSPPLLSVQCEEVKEEIRCL